MVSLQDITASNWHDICALTVAPEQASWVAPNDFSLLQAAYGLPGELAHLRLVPLAIFADETPVGFALYNTAPERDRFFIMRVMIDWRHQHRGYGRAALQQMLALFRVHPQAKEVAVSYQADNPAAGELYRSCGFVEVGVEGDEVMMWQPLHPQPVAWESFWNPAFVYEGASEFPALKQ
ncbi:MAG TPA: GNAT family N-acetyltransferase [Roseiflexaceae bacterium]|nr:GNAT family N-acetyltransferase [Roseiflexaceae bacterium]